MRTSEDCRNRALRGLNEEWRNNLPCIPLTKEELKVIVNKQYELKAIQLFESICSDSAGVLRLLKLAKEMIIVALSALRDKRKEQVNVLNLLSGARFEFHFHGVLAPTCCKQRRYSRTCKKEDTYEHLLQCYSLTEKLAAGPDMVNFLVNMAKATATEEPDRPIPVYVVSQKTESPLSKGTMCQY